MYSAIGFCSILLNYHRNNRWILIEYKTFDILKLAKILVLLLLLLLYFIMLIIVNFMFIISSCYI